MIWKQINYKIAYLFIDFSASTDRTMANSILKVLIELFL